MDFKKKTWLNILTALLVGLLLFVGYVLTESWRAIEIKQEIKDNLYRMNQGGTR